MLPGTFHISFKVLWKWFPCVAIIFEIEASTSQKY